jgi:hypothetical protein
MDQTPWHGRPSFLTLRDLQPEFLIVRPPPAAGELTLPTRLLSCP